MTYSVREVGKKRRVRKLKWNLAQLNVTMKHKLKNRYVL